MALFFFLFISIFVIVDTVLLFQLRKTGSFVRVEQKHVYVPLPKKKITKIDDEELE